MPGITDVLTPEQIAEYQSAYNQRAGQYENTQSDYDRALRLLDYKKQAYDRTASMWNQLQQQQMGEGSPYGSDRFYLNGEIFQFDPTSNTYRGAISNTTIQQPGEYVAPELGTAPLPFDTYMANDPYYQIANDPNNPNYDTVQASTGTGVVTPPAAPAPPAAPVSTGPIGPTTPNPGTVTGQQPGYEWNPVQEQWIRTGSLKNI